MEKFLTVCGVVACLAIAGGTAGAQQTRYSGGWSNPDKPAALGPSNADLQKLTDELTRLVDEAERGRAADPRLLRDLRDLARRYAWPWRQKVLTDNFSDGELARNPAWSVWGRDLRVDKWDGVSMRVAAQAPAPAARPRRDDRRGDLALDLLGSVFQQLSTPRQQGREAPAPQPAATAGEAGMKTRIAVPNAFALRITMESATRGRGRFEFGVTQGKGNLGYRLAYNPGATPSLEVLRVGKYGSAVIDAVPGPVRLEDGKRHVLQLTRDSVGEIAVSVDGKELIRVRDRSFRSAFDGVVLIGKGGRYTIRSIAAYGAKK